MTDFQTRLEELRTSIYQGNVTEGVTTLGTWLMSEDMAPHERIELLLELILLAVVCGDIEEALERWEEVQCWNYVGETVRMKAYSGFFQFLDGKKKRALALFEHCLEEMPDSFEFYLLRGIGYSQFNQYEYAQADLDRANALSPNNVLVMSTMGDICVEMHNYDRAIALHEAVLEMSPDFRRSLMSLGVLFFDLGRTEEAYSLFQCLVAYDPMNWFAWTCLGDIRSMERGRTFQALPYYAASVVAGATTPQTFLNLARGLFLLGKYDQGLNVLERFEKSDEHWGQDELPTVRYLQLIGKVLHNPSLLESDDKFQPLFRKLGQCSDKENNLLFKIFGRLSSITYQSKISTIFDVHMSVFVELAKYMSKCSCRVIYPEESIMLCILAHLLIWNGLTFEARAILGMLSRAEDPRICDATDYLWTEFYANREAARTSGVDIQKLHELIMTDSDSEMALVLLQRYKHLPPDVQERWQRGCSQALRRKECNDFSRALFQFPYDEVFAELDAFLNRNPENKEAYLNRFWELSEECFERKAQGAALTFDFPNDIPVELQEILKKFAEIENQEEQTRLSRRTTAERREWAMILCSIARHEYQISELPEIFVDNENSLRICAVDPSEALSGFEPLPFAIDGTAFGRFMPVCEDRIATLDANSLEHYWHEAIERESFAVSRAQTGAAIKALSSDKMKSLEADCVSACRILHGQKPLSGEFIDSLGDSLAGILERTSAGHALNRVCQGRAFAEIARKGKIKFPQSPLVSTPILFRSSQKIPSWPQSAAVYRVPVPYNFLTRDVIVEQAFTRAVYAIQMWHSTRNAKELKIFFEDPSFVFQPYLKGRKGEKQSRFGFRSLNYSRSQLHVSTALNSDTEIKCGKKRSNRLFHTRPGFHAQKDGISSALGLGASLDAFEVWADKPREPSIVLDSAIFVANHPFANQFWAWAEHFADKVWKEISEIEASVREMSPSNQFVVLWQIHNILRRYPWFSKVYLLLAAVYVRLDDKDKAIQAIQSGLVWEDRLFKAAGWMPLNPDDKQKEKAVEPIEAPTEFEESQTLIWPERFVIQPNDESMYHYTSLNNGFSMRRRYPMGYCRSFQRVELSDRGGCYDFYRMFRKFIQTVPQLQDAWLSGLCVPGVYSLRDYLVHIITELVSPITFPLRRELAEVLFQLYPGENPGALARFYCDNLQTANALPYAAYAQLAEVEQEDYDDISQSSVTLGCLLYDMGYMDDAMMYLDRAVSVKNASPMAFLTKGCALIELRDFHGAIKYLKEGQKIDPDSDRFFYNMALAYIELGQLDEAESAIKSGITRSQYPVDLNMQLMRIYVKKGQFVDALPLARYVVSEDPELFANALRFADFEEFAKMRAVQKLLNEYGIKL